MLCPNGHANAPGTRFCGTCGAGPLGLGTIPGGVQGGTGWQQPPVFQYRQPSNGMGVAALVCGILSLLLFGCIFGPLAIIFGSIGIAKANRGEATNKGAAGTGLGLGIAGSVIWLIVVLAFSAG